MMNDRALWWRAKPYIVDLNELEEHGFEWARYSWKYVSSTYEFLDCYDPNPALRDKYLQPCLDFIDSASKQRWKQVEYYNLLDDYDSWPVEDSSCVKYQSLWESLDTGAQLYVFYIDGNGFVSLDTKENALVVGVSSLEGWVISLDFVYCAETYHSLAQLTSKEYNPIELKKMYNKPLSMEETKKYLGVIEVDHVFEYFKLLTKFNLIDNESPDSVSEDTKNIEFYDPQDQS